MYVVDPKDPRAPPQEIWDRLSEEERVRILDSLPSEFPVDEAAPPEGGFHQEEKESVRDQLRRFFGRRGRAVFLGSELPVYYPGERMFSPDVIAVLDVDPHTRDAWVVSVEKKGLDFAFEVTVRGDRRKDAERNVDWFARLGIPEYLMFDWPRKRLTGFRLSPGGSRSYQPIVPQGGRYSSMVLGLEFGLLAGRVRVFDGTAPLPNSDELIRQLEGMIDDVQARAQAAEERAEEEARKREEEACKREESERHLAEALAEVERLRRNR